MLFYIKYVSWFSKQTVLGSNGILYLGQLYLMCCGVRSFLNVNADCLVDQIECKGFVF